MKLDLLDQKILAHMLEGTRLVEIRRMLDLTDAMIQRRTAKIYRHYEVHSHSQLIVKHHKEGLKNACSK